MACQHYNFKCVSLCVCVCVCVCVYFSLCVCENIFKHLEFVDTDICKLPASNQSALAKLKGN